MTSQYSSYLLRIWLVKDDPPEFRIQLENSMTKTQVGFSSFEMLSNFLSQQIQSEVEEE
jgi:hypothetical protein